MLNKDIAIDLGTSNIRIFIPNKGIVINEPSVITVDNATGDIIAAGKKAYDMIGRTSDKITVSYPLNGGVISDFDLAERLVSGFLKKVYSNMIVMPRVVVCIPGEMTEVEKRAVVNAISTAGVRKICLIENPIAAAIGAGIDVFSPHGSFVVDIGGGTTDMAVISLSGVSEIKSLKTGGQDIDNAIIKYIRKKYNLLIGFPTAEKIKNSIGCVMPMKEKLTYTVKGKNMIDGIPKRIEIDSEEIYGICSDTIDKIIKVICDVLEKTSPELIGDIYTNGIFLTGGLSNLPGADEAVSKETKLKVTVATEPELCGVKGAGESLKFINDLSDKSYGVLNPLMVEY